MRSALRARLGLLPAPLVPRHGEPDKGLMARALMLLFLGGMAITLVSLLLPDAVENADRTRMLVMATSAFGIAAILFVGYDRLPMWVFPVFLACGTLLIEWTVYASGENTSPYAMFWFWSAIYAFYFFPRWQAFAQLTFIALAYAALLTLTQDPGSAPVVRWVVTTSALIVAGAMIGLLKDRVNRLVVELHEISRVDPATTLLNRRGFVETLERAIELARRTQGRVTVVIGQLDHQADVGRVGQTFLEAVRRSDVAARIGDRTFAVVAAGTDAHGGYVLAERIHAELRHVSHAESMSFGVAGFPDHADAADELMAAAHGALAEAQALGAGRVVTHGAVGPRHGVAPGGRAPAVT